MRRNFGLTRPQRVVEITPRPLLAHTQRHANENLRPLPSGSMPDDPFGPLLKSFDFSDTFRDVIAVCFVLLFVMSVALAFLGAIFFAAFFQF